MAFYPAPPDTTGLVQVSALLTEFRTRTGNPAALESDMYAAMMVRATPSDTPPPQVGQTSATGDAMVYARGNHTHKSSVQRQRVSVPLVGSTGKGTVTFGQAYDTGVTPIIVTEVQTPDQTGYVYLSSVVAKTNTGFTVMVRKINSSFTLPGVALSLLNLVISIFVQATGTVDVEYIAAPATA